MTIGRVNPTERRKAKRKKGKKKVKGLKTHWKHNDSYNLWPLLPPYRRGKGHLLTNKKIIIETDAFFWNIQPVSMINCCWMRVLDNKC